MSANKLDNLAKVVSMLASIAVPVTIGFVGWGVQRTIAEQGLRKDYTDIALRVLTQDQSAKPDLRQWAIDILDKNAPLPFSADVRRQLLGGGVLITKQLKITIGETLMESPEDWVDPPKGGFSSDEALIKNYKENYIRAARNLLTLKALQEEVRINQKSQAEFEVELQDIDSKYRRGTLEDLSK